MATPERPRLLTQIKQYKLLRELGRGSMGTVYEAVDTHDQSRVAVKLLHPWLAAQDPSYRERFEREAHIAALLRSPYTVRLLDFGVAEDTCFLVTEYVAGQTLADLVAAGPLDLAVALRIGIGVARALEEAAARGVVHRDIKPANILLTPDGRVKVADFGIARHEGGAGVTAAGTFVGTAEYAAPEQAAGESDHRTDIYALGAVLYCMVVGRPPYQGATAWDVLRLHRTARLPTAPLEPLPEAAANPIRRCLEKDPRDRYQQPAELAAALERALAGLGQEVERPTLMEGIAPAPASLPATQRAVAPGERRRRRLPGGRWLVIGGLGGLLAAILGVALLLAGGNGGREPVPAGTTSPAAGGEQSENPAVIPVGSPTPGTLTDLVIARALPSSSEADLGTFQPAIAIYDPLVRNKTALLAERWEFTPPATWTFVLKRGVLFHDGSAFTAADVVAAFDNLARTTATNAIGARVGATTAVDAYTVRFVTVSSLGADLLDKFGDVRIPKPGSDPTKLPIGTGPYRFVEYVPHTRLVVERWDGYRSANPVKSRTITFVYNSDAAARAAELMAGRVDVVIGVDPAASGNLSQMGFVIETCEKLTIAHSPRVTGGCTSAGVIYSDFVKH